MMKDATRGKFDMVAATVAEAVQGDPLDAATIFGGAFDARPFVATDGMDFPVPGPGPQVQLWPHLHGTDAMFLAVLRPAPAAPTAHID